MRYVPNLIPANVKVLPDYFKGDSYGLKEEKTILNLLSYIGAVVFFILAVIFIIHPLMTLLFGIIGLFILPQGHRFIERNLRFRLTTKIKSIFCGLIFICSAPLSLHYSEIDRKNEQQEKIQQEKDRQAGILATQKEQLRKDSLNSYVKEGLSFARSNKQNEGLKKLDSAFALVITDSERGAVQHEKLNILIPSILQLVKTGNYKIAIPKLTELITKDPNNSILFYNRAICYSKIGKIKEAVDDLKIAIQQGNSDAEKLHEKINPVRRHIIGYVTKCCDGSTSDSKGRGACSHHGGVCGSEPIYDEGERKY